MRGRGSWERPGPCLRPRLRRPWWLGATLAAVAGCGGAELPPGSLHETLVEWFRREGIAVDEVHCPQALPRERDATVGCRVVVGAEEVEVTVVVTDDDGALSVRPRHATVVAARAEPEIARTLRDQGHAVAEVRCEGQVSVARPGAEQRCEVLDADGRRFAWIGAWTGEGTRQRTRVVPLAADGGGTP